MPGILGAETQSDPLSSDSPVEVVESVRKLDLPEKLPDIVPLNGKIVVRRFEADSTSKGGIILPGQARKRPSEGIVIAVGEGRLLDNGDVATPRIKFKDHVLFPQVCGTDVKIDDLEYAILDETEILAVINSHGGADLAWTERLEQLRTGNEDEDDENKPVPPSEERDLEEEEDVPAVDSRHFDGDDGDLRHLSGIDGN
jgi:chaperonin GroES